MLAAKYTQGQGLRFEEAPLPKPSGGEVLLRIRATSICGTDQRIVRHGQRKLRDGEGVILGHEFAGTVESCGPDADFPPVGTRVSVAPNMGCGRCSMCARGLYNMCPGYSAYGINLDGSHAEFLCLRPASLGQGSVFVLPDEMPMAEASLLEPLSCAINAQRGARIDPGDEVVVFGAGPIGLMHIMLARNAGAGAVTAIDVEDERLDRARAAGADRTCNSTQEDVASFVKSATGGAGADVVITACSVKSVQEQSLHLLAPFGRLSLFGGLPKDDPIARFDSNAIHYKNLVVTGSTGGAPRDFRTALRLVAGHRVDLGLVTSHRLGIDELERGYQLALGGKALKVVFTAD